MIAGRVAIALLMGLAFAMAVLPAAARSERAARPQAPSPEPAAARGDLLIGTQRLALDADQGVIKVPDEIGKFERLRFRLPQATVIPDRISIVYADGSTTDISADDRSSGAALVGDWHEIKPDQFVREITIGYRPKRRATESGRIEVVGQLAQSWLGSGGEGRKYNAGWVRLGATVAGFVGFDAQAIPVVRNDGGFRKLRLTARDRTVALRELSVKFGDGSILSQTLDERIAPDASYGPIDLKDATTSIAVVRARYRSRFFDEAAKGPGHAMLEVWALY